MKYYIVKTMRGKCHVAVHMYTNSIEELELDYIDKYKDNIININRETNKVQYPQCVQSFGNYGDPVYPIALVGDGNTYKTVYHTAIGYNVMYASVESVMKMGVIENTNVLDLRADIGSNTVIQQCNAFIAESKLLGIDLNFRYVIEKDNVVYTKYLGTSENVIIPDFITSIASRAFVGTKLIRSPEDIVKTVKIGKSTKFIGKCIYTTHTYPIDILGLDGKVIKNDNKTIIEI